MYEVDKFTQESAGYPIPCPPDLPSEVVTPIVPTEDDDDDWIAPPVEEEASEPAVLPEGKAPWMDRLREDVPMEPLELDHLDVDGLQNP
eukprot:5477346-Amphidinium_carterae.1